MEREVHNEHDFSFLRSGDEKSEAGIAESRQVGLSSRGQRCRITSVVIYELLLYVQSFYWSYWCFIPNRKYAFYTLKVLERAFGL